MELPLTAIRGVAHHRPMAASRPILEPTAEVILTTRPARLTGAIDRQAAKNPVNMGC